MKYACILLALSIICGKIQSSVFENVDEKTMIQERAYIAYINESLAEMTLELFAYNRTTRVMNLSFQLKKALTQQAKILVALYKFSGNVYKLSAIQFEVLLKSDVIESTIRNVRELLEAYCKPPIKAWPIKPNVEYNITGWTMDPGVLPRYIPEGQWKAELKLQDVGQDIFRVDWFINIKQKM